MHGTTNRTELEYQLAWARTYLKKAGLIVNSKRGVWTLTPEGQSTSKVDPRTVVQLVQKQARVVVTYPDDQVGGPADVQVDGDETASWRDLLMGTLLAMSPAAFERLCRKLLIKSGFIEVEVTGRSGDGGIDGHGIIRIAGLISFPVFFQCKRYKDNIGPNLVRDFRGAMAGRTDKGLMISTGGFTKEAKAEATRDGVPPIDLISGDLLIDKLKEFKLGVSTRMVEITAVEVDWFDSL